MIQLTNISDSNARGELILSSIKQMERKSLVESPSVKVVLSGLEQYRINGRHYELGHERFLLVDNNSEVEINIRSNKDVKGICIFPHKELINEVAKTRTASYESLLDTPFENKELQLIHNQFNYRDNRTGRFLQQHMASLIHLHEHPKVPDLESFYMQLAECIIEDQLELEGKLKQIATVKKATKEELYRRVALAKDFVEDNFTQKISLDDLAQEALLSKYHFTRTFKQLFQLSPYQYLLKLRLKKAQELLSLDYSYNEISHLIGFSDGKNLRKALKNFSSK